MALYIKFVSRAPSLPNTSIDYPYVKVTVRAYTTADFQGGTEIANWTLDSVVFTGTTPRTGSVHTAFGNIPDERWGLQHDPHQHIDGSLAYDTTYNFQATVIGHSVADGAGEAESDLYEFTTESENGGAPNKPTDPTPENNDTGVDFSGFTLSWLDGGGDTETYNVYIGETGALTPVSVAQAGVSYVTTLAELQTIFSASPIDQKIYWRVDATNEHGTTTGDEWNFDPRPAKATVPSPAHEETGVKLSTTPLSYTVDETVDINFKIQGGAYTEIATSEDVSLWRTPYVILNIKDYNPATLSGYRSPVAGDVIYDDTDSYTIAYVVVGDLINVQYQAKLYAFRTQGPGDKSAGDVLINGTAPDVENPQAVRVTLNDQWHFHGDVGEIYLPPDTTFIWRVDVTNNFGTAIGDEWEFTTPAFKFVKTSYALIAGGSGSGPYDYPPGEEGTDWNWTGENNIVTIRRLIVAAKNTIWIEDI